MRPQDIIKKKPYLAWYVKEPDKLSDESVLEHVLNYGSWDDVQKYIQIIGIQKTAQAFVMATQHKRSNYFPEIQHFFMNYFKRHAS